jgi:hypothetical protein
MPTLQHILARYLEVSEEQAQQFIQLVSTEQLWSGRFNFKGTTYQLDTHKLTCTELYLIQFLQALGQATWFQSHNRSEFKIRPYTITQKKAYFNFASSLGFTQKIVITIQPDCYVILGSSESGVKIRIASVVEAIQSGYPPLSGCIFGLGCNRPLGDGVLGAEETSKKILLAAGQEPTEMSMITLLAQAALGPQWSYQAINTVSTVPNRDDHRCVTTADTAINLKIVLEQMRASTTQPMIIAISSNQPFIERQRRDMQAILGSNYQVIAIGAELTQQEFMTDPKSVAIFLGALSRLFNIQYTKPGHLEQFNQVLSQEAWDQLKLLVSS